MADVDGDLEATRLVVDAMRARERANVHRFAAIEQRMAALEARLAEAQVAVSTAEQNQAGAAE